MSRQFVLNGFIRSDLLYGWCLVWWDATTFLVQIY